MYLYLHIPFCQSRCSYCSFYSNVSSASVRDAFVRRLCEEIGRQKHEKSDTIYLGGGTPSLLSDDNLKMIFSAVSSGFLTTFDTEITIEGNPDDITLEKVDFWKEIGINRVSLGVQSFDDEDLKKINRRHNACQAENAVKLLHENGFENISIDLIYGLPGQTLEGFQRNLQKAFSLPITHLSSYALSIEEGTPMHRQGVKEVDDEVSRAMYEMLMQHAENQGFEHYEISNFAKEGYRSRHNSAYWTGEAYLGLGPGAHGYDGDRKRTECVPDLKDFIENGATYREEILTDDELYDEKVMCRLRTREGLNINELEELKRSYLLQNAEKHLKKGWLKLEGSQLSLTREGLFVSDAVMSDLMRVGD